MSVLSFRGWMSVYISFGLSVLMLASLLWSRAARAQALFTEPNVRLQGIDTGVTANLIAEIDRQLALGAIVQNRYTTIDTPPTGLESITLNLFPDLTLIASKGWEDSQPDGQQSWVGKIVDDPMSFVSLVYKNGQMMGEIRTGGALYQIRHLANGVHAIKAPNRSFHNTECKVDGSNVVH